MIRRQSHLAFTLPLLLCAFVGTGRGEVIISEIMYDVPGSDTLREWIELYNTGPNAVDISGWQLGDAADNQWATAFPANTFIGAGQARVVTGDTVASFEQRWGAGTNVISVGSFPLLANDPSTNSERPSLRNSQGAIVDAVAYSNNFNQVGGWPKTDANSDVQSIYVLPQGLTVAGNDLGANWRPSTWGAYGATFRNTEGDSHASPGTVATIQQAPFAPSPDAAWSMVYMPDTQNYVKWAEYQYLLPQLTTWIRDNKDAYKIKAVLQGGDIVNNNNTTNPSSGDQTSAQQWPAAQAGFFVLNGHLPYILAAGNHDHGTTNAQSRETMINNYFKPTDNPLVDPAQGGILAGQMVAGEIQNAYYAFTAPDGRKMLIFNLEWEPRPATVAWANGIAALPQYADYTASLLTHNYLESDSTRSTTTNVAADASGQELWDNLIKTHDNFEWTINGHFGGDGTGYLQSTNNFGNSVKQMFFNTQFETMGGNGWIRFLEFLQDGRTVRVRDYSPLLDVYRTDAAHSFSFQLSQLPVLPGDYTRDGKVDAADYVLWRNTNGQAGSFAADGNGDRVVDVLDYTVWRQNYGDQAGSGSTEGVPEPNGFLLLLVAGMMVAAWSRTFVIPDSRAGNLEDLTGITRHSVNC